MNEKATKEQTLTGNVKGVLKDIEDIKKELQDIRSILEPKEIKIKINGQEI